MFTHKDIHKGKLMSPDSTYSNQIDHVLINDRFANNVTKQLYEIERTGELTLS